MPETSKDRLHGTLDALILKALSWGPRHGYAVARWIENETSSDIEVEEGSLYPSLYRMERKGWLQAEWGMSELNRRVKLYKLSAEGRKRLRQETVEWMRFAAAVSRILTAS